jgi:hypothetical protein
MTNNPHPRIQTNDDLYLAVTALHRAHQNQPPRDLETYLRSLLGVALDYWPQPVLPPEVFVHILDQAYTTLPVDYDPHWEQTYNKDWASLKGWDRFQTLLRQQIVDLRQMYNNGTLPKTDGTGVTSPQGGSWYNLDIKSFLECACRGNFDGWSPDDAVIFNPPETPIAQNDTIQQIAEETSPLPPITWEQFADFLYCGQIFE